MNEAEQTKSVTHRHTGNALKYHWDGDQWWYFSPTYGTWVKSEFIVENKMVKI